MIDCYAEYLKTIASLALDLYQLLSADPPPNVSRTALTPVTLGTVPYPATRNNWRRLGAHHHRQWACCPFRG